MEGRIMKAKVKIRFADLPREYAALCRVFLPRPIHDSVDYANVSEVADAMVRCRDDFSHDQADYFDLLCTLIEEYDAENVKWPRVTGVEALKHLLDERGLAPADLSRILGGSRNLGAMILRGDRNLTLGHIRKLAAHFKVSPELFI
jgi:HTH-type transcriptional regulator / antitoxin HigA